MNIPPDNQYQVQQILDSQLLKHVRSKRDLWEILVHVGQFHMPTCDETTMYFMKQVLAGHKRLIRLEHLVPCTVPRLNEFRVDLLYQQAM